MTGQTQRPPKESNPKINITPLNINSAARITITWWEGRPIEAVEEAVFVLDILLHGGSFLFF